MGTESEGEVEGEESAEYDLEGDLRDKAKSRSKKVGKMVKESLKGVEVGIQEALIVEDLLFVLMVSSDLPLSGSSAECTCGACLTDRRSSPCPGLLGSMG